MEESGQADPQSPAAGKEAMITHLIYKFAFSKSAEVDSERKRQYRDALESGFERLEAMK